MTSSFQFKNFIIHQDDAPLKVTTDACLFGALIDCENAENILDIGTGTGLLALMIAQRNTSSPLTGIEIDRHSAELAENNFLSSKYGGRFRIIEDDANNWSVTSIEKFDLIVCNPPFFSSSMKNNDERKTIARHNDSLTHENLSSIISKHLSANGNAWVMLPPNEMEEFISVCGKKNLFGNKKYSVSSSEMRKPHFMICAFSFSKKEFSQEKIFIHNSEGKYTREFTELLSPFYLHL